MEYSKSDIDRKYLNLIFKLENAKREIGGYKSNETKFGMVQNVYIQSLNETIMFAQQRLEEVRNNIVWDKLVIAFFGETNAGKSTIIETFRILFGNGGKGEDGIIVGDGRSDFTKVYAKYDLSIDGQPFTLIDVPGIEGREEDYKEEIQEALLKAHCVFYVQGHNKEPDTKTAEKIKKYLNEWVKVYSIYNVRGGVENYDEEEERETLFTPAVNKQISLNTSRFKNILGSCYQGNITLQALIAMCSYASFSSSRSDLTKQQILLKKFFGNGDTAFAFSNFQVVQDAVHNMSKNFRGYIIDANMQKFSACTHYISININRCKTNNNQQIIELCDQLSKYKINVEKTINQYRNNIKKSIFNLIDSQFNNTLKLISKAIDDEREKLKQYSETLGEELGKKLSNEIQYLFADNMQSLSNQLEKLKKDLKKNINVLLTSSIKKSNVDIAIDTQDALKNLEIDFNDVMGIGGFVLGGAGIGSYFTWIAPGVATALGAFGGLILGIISYVCFSKDEKKSKAKNKVNEKMEEVKIQLKSEVNNKIDILFKEINKEKKEIFSEAFADIASLQAIKLCVDELHNRLKKATIINKLM